jgi:hypothetical protein
MARSVEYDAFNAAMDIILKADPVKVKAAVDAEIRASVAEREARGERKRGRKAKETSREATKPNFLMCLSLTV